MTVEEAIGQADELRPNAFSEQTKARWLGALDGRLALDVLLLGHEDAARFQYEYPGDAETALLVAPPHDDLYPAWLIAKVDEANGEYERYQNAMAIFNALYGNFVRWFARTYEPAQGYRPEWGGAPRAAREGE